VTKIPQGEVSATKFNTAFGKAGCGMKFYYRYVEGIRGPVTASLHAGIAFDMAARQLHENRIVGSEIADPHDVFVDAWENPPEENRDGEVIDYDLSGAPVDIIDRGANALNTYEQHTESMKPLETQVFVEAEFDETDAKLVGFIDLVEAAATGVCVSDVKTSLSSRKKWTVEDAARDAQLGIYSLLAKQSGRDVTVVGWRHARLGGKIEVGSTHIQAPDDQQTMRRITNWVRELEAWCETGDFPPTGLDRDAWVCSGKYCDYYHKCAYGAKAQTVNPVTIGGNS
jgi:hypothetical protein